MQLAASSDDAGVWCSSWRSAGYLVVGTATVIGCPAQDRASQEKADQEIGEECSHRRGLAVRARSVTLKPIVFRGSVKPSIPAKELIVGFLVQHPDIGDALR